MPHKEDTFNQFQFKPFLDKSEARYAPWEMEKLLNFFGADIDCVKSSTAYHKDTRHINKILEVACEFWPNEKPTCTFYMVHGPASEGGDD